MFEPLKVTRTAPAVTLTNQPVYRPSLLGDPTPLGKSQIYGDAQLNGSDEFLGTVRPSQPLLDDCLRPMGMARGIVDLAHLSMPKEPPECESSRAIVQRIVR